MRYRDHQPSPAIWLAFPVRCGSRTVLALSPHQLNSQSQSLSTSPAALFGFTVCSSPPAADIYPRACAVARCPPVACTAICIHRPRSNHFLPLPRRPASPSWSSESAIFVTAASRRRSTSSAMNGRVSSATLLNRALLTDTFRHQGKTLRV